MPNAILDPTGRADFAPAARSRGLVLAPRPPGLAGLRVGLMNNTKHNAALLLAEIGKLLAAEHAEASVTVAETKPNFAAPDSCRRPQAASTRLSNISAALTAF
ncbi:MAG: hypothetical protein WB800_20820, partial [Streptosporangiaceae bacterium]